MADVFESLVAAIYLDGGMEVAKTFILKHIAPRSNCATGGRSGFNYKSVLQQVAQREHGTIAHVSVDGRKGPDHSKCFKIAAVVGNAQFHAAWGRNEKEAEQRAARNALSELVGEGAALRLRLRNSKPLSFPVSQGISKWANENRSGHLEAFSHSLSFSVMLQASLSAQMLLQELAKPPEGRSMRGN